MTTTDTTTLSKPAQPSARDAPQRSLLGATDSAAHRARDRKRAVARTLRRALVGLLLVAAAIGVVVALRPRPVPVDAAQASRGPLVVAIEESGMTRVKDRYIVSAPVSGSVSRIALEPGDPVKAGDLLAVIVPAQSPLLDERSRSQAEARVGAATSALGQARAQVSRAGVAKELADQELARLQRLEASGSVAHAPLDLAEFEARMRVQELASAEFAAKVAGEEVRAASAALGRDGRPGERGPADRHVDVLAPVAGRILRVHQKSASVVPTGAVLVEVGDPTALEVVVDLLTTDAVHVEPGTPVTIEGWGGAGALAGRVHRIEPSAFTRPSALGVDEQRVNVIIALTEPRSASLAVRGSAPDTPENLGALRAARSASLAASPMKICRPASGNE
jgi:HlyD family secretion protein